jgi:Dehydrogenases with different specificities (related to short-chain alcohol dehydrogenases)
MNNPFSLESKTILITGASSGIGRAIAIECSKLGANLIITGRNEQRLSETLSLMNGESHKAIIADLNNEDHFNNLIERTTPINGLVHCAGFVNTLPFQFINRKTISSIMDVNFFAPTLLSVQLLKKKKIEKDSSIVFISSISGKYCTYIANSMYTASKSAVDGIVKGMALDLAPKNIRVNTVNPGMVDTKIYSKGTISREQLAEDVKKYPLKRYGKPEDIAYAVIYLLSDASSWVTGSNLLIDGGYTLQ